jgi:GNAT superfamily N-acetyltransferase
MIRFEHCMAADCIEEMIAFKNENYKMETMFNAIHENGKLKHGTVAELVKLYVDETLVGYSLFENYEKREGKSFSHNDIQYNDLGVVHFVTSSEYRGRGYASKIAEEMFKRIINPILNKYGDNSYVVATGRAVPLMQRTNLDSDKLVTQFYSEVTFEEKVVNYLAAQSELIKAQSLKKQNQFYDPKNEGIIKSLTSKFTKKEDSSFEHEFSI